MDKFCTKCDEPSNNDAKMCWRCGGSDFSKAKFCTKCDRATAETTMTCRGCGGSDFSEYPKVQRHWMEKNDDELKWALAGLKGYATKVREAIMAEIARRGLLLQKTDDEMRLALAGIKGCAKEAREAIVAEATRRGILQNVQVVKMLDLDIPFGSMILLAFKWTVAFCIAALPFVLVISIATCAVQDGKKSQSRYGY